MSMNIVFLLIGLLIGLVMTGIVYYLLHKQNMELKKEVEEVISLRSSNQLLQSRMDDMQREMLEYKNKDEEKNKEIQNNIRIIAQYKTQQEP